MKINGVKYLDANNFDKLIIREKKDDINIKATSNCSYETDKSKYPISKELRTMNIDDAKFEVIDYFLRNNAINCLKDNVFLSYYEGRFSKIGTPGRELYLQAIMTPNSRKMLNNIFQKFYYDRDKEIYASDNIDVYEVYISNESSYRTYELNGIKIFEIKLNYKDGIYKISKKDMEFLTEFVKHKLSLCDSEAVVKSFKYVNSILMGYYENDHHLICDNLNIAIKDNRLLPLFDNIADEYNIKLKERNKKQLKLEEI